MGERTREELVTFQHAFSFPGVEEQAPGTYVVEIVEETIDTLSFVAYRRVSTTIVLPSPQFGYASKQVIVIQPHDLAAAQERDATKVGRYMETRMIRFMSRLITQARVDRLMYGCDVAVLIGVFVFLAFRVVN